jgi:hypothetical protein
MTETVWMAVIASATSLLASLLAAIISYLNKRATSNLAEKAERIVEKTEKQDRKLDEVAKKQDEKLEKVAVKLDGRLSELIEKIAAERFQAGLLQGRHDERVRSADELVAAAKAKALLAESENNKTDKPTIPQ